VRRALLQIGKAYGFEVITAANSDEGIQAYRDRLRSNHPYDTVLLDINLRGGLNGVECHPHRPVADGVHHHLPAAAIEQRDDAVQLVGGVGRRSVGRPIGVGRQPLRGVGREAAAEEKACRRRTDRADLRPTR